MSKARVKPPEDIAPSEFFTHWIGEAVASDPERAARLHDTHATIQFELVGNPGGVFNVTIVDGAIEGHVGPAPDADLRVTVDVETWRALNQGAISAPEALLRRRLSMHGSLILALRLHLILG